MNAWGDLKSSCHKYLPGGLTMFLIKRKKNCKIKYGFGGSISNVDLVLDLALLISSTPYFNLLQVLAIDLVLQSLLKVATPLEDVRSCYVQCIYIKKEGIKLFLTDLFSLSYFTQFSFVTFWFC